MRRGVAIFSKGSGNRENFVARKKEELGCLGRESLHVASAKQLLKKENQEGSLSGRE